MTRRDSGFTLIELLLVVSLAGIMSAIAVPSLVRARAAALETATIGSIRAIHTAQGVYQSTCGSGYYAPSVTSLATRPTNGGTAFISPEFNANTVDRQAYRIRFTSGPVVSAAPRSCNGLAPGRTTSTYFVAADLLTNNVARVTRYFGMNQTGIVFQSRQRISPFYTGVAPAPARTIQ